MTIKREDLLAAAADGVLHYTQVEPVLIFLLQRDLTLQRAGMLRKKRTSWLSGKHALYYMAAMLLIGIATWLFAWNTKLAFNALGVGGLLWFAGLYALFAIVMAAWFERRQLGASVRIFCTSVIALLPLAVFASQQINML